MVISLALSSWRLCSFGFLTSVVAKSLLVLLVFYSHRPQSSSNAFLPKRQRFHRLRRSHAKHYELNRINPGSWATTVQMLPPLPSSYEYDDAVVFSQRATGTKILGRDRLERSIDQWQRDFDTEVGVANEFESENKDFTRLRSVRLQTSVATTTSPTTLLLRWNVTYVDPSVAWLASLADSIPGWTPDFRSYTDQVSKVRTFSYSAIGRLFADAVATGKLRVPLACIEGTATCEFLSIESDTAIVGNGTTTKRITSITEDLAYAQDLNRGAMSNRLCARDLQFFLEVARKPPEFWDATNDSTRQQYEFWEDQVTESLPWKTVPGMMDSMYIEGQSEDDLNANLPLLFGILSVLLVVTFANWIAPNLIGQSLFGPTNYIVPPSELNDILPY